jgi:hypothetical protein
MKRRKKTAAPLHHPSVPLVEVPHVRKSKHRKTVSEILSDLKRLDEFSALKIALVAGGIRKAALRSALHRAAKKIHMDLLTTSDEKYLYVFRKPIR